MPERVFVLVVDSLPFLAFPAWYHDLENELLQSLKTQLEGEQQHGIPVVSV